MDDVKKHLKKSGSKLIKQFPPPSKTKLLSQVIFGTPIWDEGVIRDFLGELLKDKSVTQLKDLDTEVLVLATNLTNLTPKVHKDDDAIISSVLNSCGLPYCFRTWKGQGDLLVDDAICENLPNEVLEEKKEEYGHIVAISFDKPKSGSPKSIKSFSLALLDTAINNSITRAKGALDPNHVHTIETDISTFDFQMALNQGLEKEYELNTLKARNFFERFVKSKWKETHGIETDFWSQLTPSSIKMMENLGRVYAIQHANSRFKYLKCSFEVIANCLLEKGHPSYGSADSFNYTLTFQPETEPIYCGSDEVKTVTADTAAAVLTVQDINHRACG